MTTQISTSNKGVSILAKFANRFSVEPGKMLGTLKSTAFKVSNGAVSDEQMIALLVVADQYKLNPFTKEIFAFPDKGGIVPVVGVDGWSRIINENSQFDGMDFEFNGESTQIDEDAKLCPESCTCIIYRKDRSHPVKVTEYLDEVYRPVGKYNDGNKKKPGAWQSHTKRMLRHKTMIQCARIAFGFTGIYDEDEAARIVEGEVINQAPTSPPVSAAASKVDKLKAKLIPADEHVDQETGEVISESEAVEFSPELAAFDEELNSESTTTP